MQLFTQRHNQLISLKEKPFTLQKNMQELFEECNIAASGYVKQENTKEEIDITVLNQCIQEIVTRQQELGSAIDAIVTDLESEG